MDVNLGDKIGLAGYAFARQGDSGGRAPAVVGAAADGGIVQGVHPRDRTTKVKLLGQMDSRPQGYASNTNRWIPGQVIYDRFEVPLPPGTPPGRYQVRVGLYNEADGQRLPVLDAAGKQVDDQVLLGEVVVP